MRSVKCLSTVLAVLCLLFSGCASHSSTEVQNTDPTDSVLSSPSNSVSEEKHSSEDDRPRVFTGKSFDSVEALCTWLSPKGFTESDAVRWLDGRSYGRDFVYARSMVKEVETGHYGIGIPCIDGNSVIDIKEGSTPIKFTDYDYCFGISYNCSFSDWDFEVTRINIEPTTEKLWAEDYDFDEQKILECIWQYGIYYPYYQNGRRATAETITIGDRSVLALQVNNRDVFRMIFFYDGEAVEIKTVGQGFLPTELLVRFDFQYAYPKITALGSVEEQTGKNSFFDFEVRTLSDFVSAAQTFSDEELNTYLAGGDGMFSYADCGIKTREDMNALLSVFEERGLFVCDSCDEYGLMYYGETKTFRSYYRIGKLNVQFDYLSPEQMQAFYNELGGSGYYQELKGAISWQGRGKSWWYNTAEKSYVLEDGDKNLVITFTGEDTVRLEAQDREAKSWFRDEVSKKFELVNDRTQFQ